MALMSMKKNDEINNFKKDNYHNDDNIYNTVGNRSLSESDNLSSSSYNRPHSIDKKRTNEDSFSNSTRDASALYIILRSCIILSILVLSIFLIKWGTTIYRDNKIDHYVITEEKIPILENTKLINDNDYFINSNKLSFFESQINIWEESNRFLRIASENKRQGNTKEAIKNCYNSLNINSANIETMKLLINLYSSIENNEIEMINTILRILTFDNNQPKIYEKLITVLYEISDYESVIFLSEYYQKYFGYSYNINFLYANALKNSELLDEALICFNRLLKDNPHNEELLNSKIDIHIRLHEYESAISLLDIVYKTRYREEKFYKDYIYCSAKLGNLNHVINNLSKSVNIFGRAVIVKWIEDPVFDIFKDDKMYIAFLRRLSSEDFNKSMSNVLNQDQSINLKIKKPDFNQKNESFDLLKRK